MEVLKIMPAPPLTRLVVGLSSLSPEADVFKLLEPLAKNCPKVPYD